MLSFTCLPRTPHALAQIAVQVNALADTGCTFQADSGDRKCTSGRRPFRDGAIVHLPLPAQGEHVCSVSVFDADGCPVIPETDTMAVTRATAPAEGSAAARSVGIGAPDRPGGRPVSVRPFSAGETLPVQRTLVFKACLSVPAGKFPSPCLQAAGGRHGRSRHGQPPSRRADNHRIGF